MQKSNPTTAVRAVVIALAVLAATGRAFSHCDGMDGPVVKSAQQALDAGDANLVMSWVKKADEPQIKKVFEKTLTVRKLNPEAKELADMYFFETLVRVHRAGEGAPYTGLKPAGRDVGPAIPAADKALEAGSVEPVVKLITDRSRDTIEEAFKRAFEARKSARGDVDKGREFVEAYVTFIHSVEGLYEASKGASHGHFEETGEPSAGDAEKAPAAPAHHHE